MERPYGSRRNVGEAEGGRENAQRRARSQGSGMQGAWGTDLDDSWLGRGVWKREHGVEEESALVGRAGVAEVGERLRSEPAVVEEIGVMEVVLRKLRQLREERVRPRAQVVEEKRGAKEDEEEKDLCAREEA